MVPPDNDVVVIVNCAVIVRVRFTIALCAGEPASVALNVSGVPVTAMAGVPLIAPVEAFSVNPVGSVPRISCQLHAPVPPVLASVCEYAVFTMPLASAVVVITRGGATNRIRFAVAVCCGIAESFTVTATVLLPAVAGVPPISPVEALIERFAGNPVADQVKDPVPPLALSVAL